MKACYFHEYIPLKPIKTKYIFDLLNVTIGLDIVRLAAHTTTLPILDAGRAGKFRSYKHTLFPIER